MFQFLSNNPSEIIFGLTLSSFNVSEIIGIDYAESLFFDVLLRYGLVGLVFICFIFFYFFWKAFQSDYGISSEKTMLRVFFLGFFAANITAGASFLTDFFLPILLLLFINMENSNEG